MTEEALLQEAYKAGEEKAKEEKRLGLGVSKFLLDKYALEYARSFGLKGSKEFAAIKAAFKRGFRGGKY